MSSSHFDTDRKRPGEITGIITPAEWDEFDRVTAVKICATDDEDYLVENSETLLGLVQCSIQASGMISQPKNELRKILVHKFAVIKR